MWITLSRERERESNHGIPIGNLTSQLFANVYMNPFDHFVKERLGVKNYLRYTDDFILVHQDPNYLAALIEPMKKFLRDRLRLDLHPKKIVLRKVTQGIDFLGYVILPKYRRIRTKTKRRMFRKIRREELDNPRLQSYLGMLGKCNEYAIEQKLRRTFLEQRKR